MLPFLFAEHRAPLPSFYDEWLGAVLALLAVLAFLLSRSGKDSLPDLSLWLAAFAAWLAIQALMRQPAFVQLSLAGIVYLLLAALAAWLGRALVETHGAERVADALAGAVLVGATLNASIGIVQFYGVPVVLDSFIASPGRRIAGHVGQASLFAQYLALGQASLLYLVARGRLRAPWWWGIAALLVLASACSQARAAIPFALLSFILALLLRNQGSLARHAGVLVLASVIAALAIPRLHEGVVDRFFQAHAEPRPALWALAWRLFADSPWLGVGWGEFAGAAFRAGLPPELGALNVIWTSPHNLFLHVAAEAGVVGLVLVFLAVLRWGHHAWGELRAAAALPTWWSAALVGTIVLDALVGYPLWYAHVLVLAALVAGVGARAALRLPDWPLRTALATMSALALALLAWTLHDYQRFDRAYVVASGRTLAPAAEVSAALAELRALERGPLGALAAPWTLESRKRLEGASAR